MSLKTTQFPPIIIADKTATILTGQLKSEVVDLLGTVLVALLTESAMLNNASLTFETSVDGVTFFPAFNDASIPLAISMQPNRHVALDITDFASLRFIKLVVDLTEGSDIVFRMLTRPAL